jgi:hypothetical protein
MIINNNDDKREHIIKYQSFKQNYLNEPEIFTHFFENFVKSHKILL